MAKKIQLQDANGNVLHPLTLGECVTMDNGENLDTLMSKSQMFTPTITQDKSMFKVGTGVDVDYSANVKDGAYESLVFKGKSLVNLWKKHDTHNQRNFTLYEDGFMETVPNVLYFDHIQKANTGMIKPNTKYLLIVEVVKNTLPVPISFQSDNRTYFYGNSGMMFGAGETGVVKKIITSISDLSTTRDDLRWGAYIQFAQDNVSESERGVVKIRQMLIEYQQGMENWDIPYFTGICDSKMPILRNVGKNLFDLSRMNEKVFAGGGSPNIINLTDNSLTTTNNNNTTSGYGYVITNLKKGVPYRLTVTNDSVSTGIANFNVSKRDGNSWYEQRIISIPIGNTASRIIYADNSTLNLSVNIMTNGANGQFTAVLKNIQIEEVSSENDLSTPYEDYKSNILRTSEEIVLREVGGVQDTYNPLTGEYVRRIGEVVINGDDSINYNFESNSNDVTSLIHVSIPNTNRYFGFINDQMIEKIVYASNITEEGIFDDWNGVFIRILNSKLDSPNLEGVKAYLRSNPITVQYELAEPVTTIVKPSTMTPFAYQNGHVILESGF